MSVLTNINKIEDAVGIREYIHPELVGISGIFKQRFSDFVVREITLEEDEVVYLRDVDGSKLEKMMFAEKVEEEDEPDWKASVSTVTGEVVAEKIITDLLNLFTDKSVVSVEEQQRLKDFLQRSYDKIPDSPSEFIGLPSSDKAVRGQMHQIVRKYAGQNFETISIAAAEDVRAPIANSKNGSLLFKIIAKASSNNAGGGNNSKNNKRGKRKFDEWPKQCPDYLQFTLMKENIDTMNCIYVLSKQLKMKPDNIKFNGTKDKRGITSQKITVYRLKPSYFQRINAYIFPPFFRCGDFKYVEKPCGLGKLAGNRFELVIRKINSGLTHEQVSSVLSQISQDGYINYFGLQRFGKGGCPSHVIGLHVVQGNWEACVHDLFAFTTTREEKSSIKLMKEKFLEKDYRKALEIIENDRFMISEKFVLQSLIKYPDDYKNAFEKISKNIRLIYLHAYQSYIWNIIASERIRKFGNQLIEGDLVYENNTSSSNIQVANDLLMEDTIDMEVDLPAETEKEEIPITEDHPTNLLGEEDGPQVHVITAQDIQEGRYSMKDVILPLVGFDIQLPSNSLGNDYLELLGKDRLTLDSFKKCPINYRLKGNYRKLLEYAKNVEWELKEYFDDNEELNSTELAQFIQQTKDKRSTVQDSTHTENTVSVAEAENQKDSKESSSLLSPVVKKALLIKFSLSPGAYATMFLRELTKESTEFDHQTSLMNA